MIFRRLLGRKKRLTASPDNQEDLIRVVDQNGDAGVRGDACRNLGSLEVLRRLLAADPDAGVREIAGARYSSLLCGQAKESPVLTERLKEIAVLGDQPVLEQVALGGAEAELRRAAITKLTSPDVLARCALDDARPENRSAAVERIDDRDALTQVVKNIGKKDTRVYRAARRKLKEIAEREALPERIRTQCRDLCEKLERLGRFGHWVQDRAMLDLLDRQWAEIEQEADLEHKARYQDLRARFLAAYEEYRNEHEAQIAVEEAREALRAARQALLDELHALTALSGEEQVADALERIATDWNGLDSLPARDQANFERKFAAAREVATRYLDALRARSRRKERLQALLGRAERALGSSRPLERKQVRTLEEEVRQLLDAEGADKSLAAGFTELREALDERLRGQKEQAEKRLGQLPEKLDELADLIGRGVLKEAEPLYRSIVAGIELIEASGLPHKAYAEQSARLRALMPKMRDLQKWRKWGTDQHRQELCIAMESLGSEDLHLEAVALRLHDLQMQWKVLDKGGSPVNHPLWDRFHTASERVYERCKPFLDQQAEEREANRQQRQQLCRELEAFLDKADWERMDWKKAVRAEREMRQAWSALGAVEARHRKALEKRFHTAIKRLDGHLAEERGRNQSHKRDLIARVEALADEPDLGLAVEETKRLQQKWYTSVPARQNEETRVWERFRAACDRVFARRREEQEAQAAELGKNLQQREDLCAEAETLAESDASVEALASGLAELDRRWRDSQTLVVPRQAAAGIAKRWRAARARVDDQRLQRLEEQRRKDLDLLADRAALCERLERALETGSGADLDGAVVETDWRALPAPSDSDLQAAMEQRFNRALEALQEGGEKLEALRSAFAADGRKRAELCLHLEILARVDSPSELAEERLQFQVTRLNEHMREGEKDPLEATYRLLQQWYLCGPAPASEAARLEERFLCARRALEAAEP